MITQPFIVSLPTMHLNSYPYINKKIMRYIDCYENRNYSSEELQALVNGDAKPYPQGWYESETEIIERRNSEFNYDINIDDVEDFSEISCPLKKWAYLYRSI